MSRRIPIEEHQLHSTPSNLARALKYAPEGANKFEAGTPEVPAHLTADEKKVWNRVVNILTARGTITVGDGFVLEKYCTLYVRWRNEANLLEEEGSLIDKLVKMGKDHLGVYVKVPNPRLKLLQTTERQLLSLDIELGLTPRHRGKPATTAPRERTTQDFMDDVDKILGMKN